MFQETFDILRRCGGNCRECAVLWVVSWDSPDTVTRVVHPTHRARAAEVEIDPAWLTGFFVELAQRGEGIRAQVHSHPGRAFHSATDDAWPAIHTPGFLSLVVPRFAQGPAGLIHTYLAQITSGGGWRSLPPADYLEVRP
ncbi:hypothetical protein [Roseisolibacter agri]|uniref:hypothetical protein n=1 Tax=Roseisolibacter agri TaxID=2014610 RepID=UPI0024E06A76|nr:hypothetical protein [Roseisolibacter agri]